MASKNIKGITIEIGGNTTKLGQAIEDSEKKTRSLQIELRQVEKLLKFDPSNVELLAQKQEILTQSITETSKKLDVLKSSQESVNEQYKKGEIGEEQLRAFQREILKTENDLNAMQQELVETNKSIDDIGKNDGIKKNALSVEEAKQQMEDLGDKAKETGKDIAVGIGAIGASLVTGMGYALKVSTDFDQALNTLATRTGATKEEMDQLDESMQNVYKNNFGESIEDVAVSMSTVKVNTKLVGEELEKATEYALLMRDVFDFDVNESTRSAKMLMDQFGLSAKEAYNLIAQGAQNGLDKNGDLLDTINEYAVHYQQLGYTSEEFFNSLVNGTQNGTFSVDKLGDAFKEFGIRTKDTATTTEEGFQLIGLNADIMRNKFAQGGAVAKKATEETVTALFGLNDEVKRNQAGVDLFGTMWEDLGEDAIASLMNVNGTISTTSGALDKINEQKYDDIGNNLKELGRTIETDVVAPLGKELQPVVKDAIGYVKENAPQIRDLIANTAKATGELVSWLVDNSSVVLATIAGIGAGVLVWKGYTIISTIVTSLQAFKIAQEGATISQLAFNTAMNANSIGLAITAISTLVTFLGVLAIATGNEKSEHEKNMEAIDNETQKRQESIDKQKEQIEARTGEITNLQGLNTELQNLVDQNGVVKEGYEDRVAFILNQLNPVLGTEMEIVDGQVQGYKDLGENIDLLLQKKKAEIILEAQLPAYKEAVTKATEGQIKANKLYNDYQETEKKNKKEIGELQAQLTNANDYEAKSIKDKITTLQTETIEKKTEYDKQNDLVKGYYDDIVGYETNSAKIQEGTIESLMEVEQSQVTGKAKNNEEKKKLLEEQLIAEKDYLAELQKRYAETNDKTLEGLIKGQESKIETTEKTLNGMISTVENKKEENKTVHEEYAGAGVEGLETGKEPSKQAGSENASAYNEGTNSQKENATQTGKDLATADKDGKASTKQDQEQVGKENAGAYVGGLASFAVATKFAGTELGKKSQEGEASTKTEHEQAGKNNADAYTTSFSTKNQNSKEAGSTLSKQTANGLLTQTTSIQGAGATLGLNAIAGINANQTNSNIAGTNIGKKALAGYTNLYNSFRSAGTDSANGIEAGIAGKAGGLATAMANLGNSMLRSFKNSLEIKSPSRKMKEAGLNTVQGLAIGINENSDLAIDSTKNMVDQMLETVDGANIEKTINTSLSLEGATTNIVGSQNSLLHRMNTLIELVSEYLPSIAENAGSDMYIDGQLMSYKLAPAMDVELSNIADFKGRGG